MTKRAKKASIGAVTAVIVLTGFVGLLHAPFAKPLLMALGGCPVGKASAAEVEAARLDAVRKTRGDAPAPARPALAFTLDQTTPEDVAAWAKDNDVSCASKREGMFIACREVPVAALGDRPADGGRVDDVSFAFRPRDRRLVNLTVTWFALPSDEAAARMNAASGRLGAALGAPTVAAGEASPARLGGPAYTTATVAYRYTDYMADVTATSFGARGVALREHYLSATE
jgi:hypothetical protein